MFKNLFSQKLPTKEELTDKNIYEELQFDIENKFAINSGPYYVIDQNTGVVNYGNYKGYNEKSKDQTASEDYHNCQFENKKDANCDSTFYIKKQNTGGKKYKKSRKTKKSKKRRTSKKR